MTEPDTGKLKTLKDLDDDDYFDPEFLIKAIREEAIKWVKSLGSIMGEGGVSAFKDFFNLTEEDIHNTKLKEENKKWE